MCQAFRVTGRGRPPLLSDEIILGKALSMFAAAGYEAMSVRALNAELGLSHETVSKRFGPKSELYRAAVTYGAERFIADFDRELAAGGAVDGLARLRATVRAFMIATARHPALGDLLHHHSIGEEQRMTIVGETGLADRIVDTVSLLGHLHDAGAIRETRIRELWFLAHGAAAPLHFRAVSELFDPFDGPLDDDEHIGRMTDAVMRTMLP